MNRFKLITEALKELGVPANLSGFHFLRYAIEIMSEDLSLARGITKRLYPMIAKKFETTPSRVERTIRHAVETGWGRGNLEVQRKLFGYTVDINKGCPANSEFICMVADYINLIEGESDE